MTGDVVHDKLNQNYLQLSYRWNFLPDPDSVLVCTFRQYSAKCEG